MTDGSRLVMSQGPQPGHTFMLDQDFVTLGRDPSNDIVISDPQISRQHARLRRQGNVMMIEDAGSTNGTFVNGMRLIGPHTLVDGDVISLGDAATLIYHGADVALTAPMAERPTVSPAPPTYEPQPTPAPPPPAAEPVEEETRTTWLWAALGCLALLIIAACVAVFVLDYLKLLPAIFYEPLRWLGVI
jgi:predicted component of type VI protein secretion system